MALQFDSYPDIAYGTGSDLDLSIAERRQLWKWEAAVGYRIFAAMRWGQLGDGHITCRDPEHRDHFWMLSYGVPFREATVHDLILIGPDGSVRSCTLSERVVGNLAEDSWDVLAERLWEAELGPCRKVVPPHCAGCEHWERCLGGCRLAAEKVHGSLEHPDPLAPV